MRSNLVIDLSLSPLDHLSFRRFFFVEKLYQLWTQGRVVRYAERFQMIKEKFQTIHSVRRYVVKGNGTIRTAAHALKSRYLLSDLNNRYYIISHIE